MNFLFPLSLAIYEVIVYLSNDMYVPALPEIVSYFHTTNQMAQLTVTACFLGNVGLQLFLGVLSDAFGKRVILLYGALVFIASTIGCALATSIGGLLTARVIQGATVSIIGVAGYALIHEFCESNRAIKTIATMNSITVLAPAFGPMLGSLVLLVGNWKMIFWLLAGLAIAVLFPLYSSAPKENLPKVSRECFRLKPIFQNYCKIVSNSNFQANTLSFCLLYSSMIAWIASGPFMVIEQFHKTPKSFGIYQVIVFGSFIVGTRLVNQLISKLNNNTIVYSGLVIAIFAAIAAVISSFFTNLLLFVICLAIFALGAGLCFSFLMRNAVDSSSQSRGVTMAVFSTEVALFGAVGSGFISLVYPSMRGLGFYLLLCALIAGFLHFWVRPTKKTRQDKSLNIQQS
jgi:MFS family permease